MSSRQGKSGFPPEDDDENPSRDNFGPNLQPGCIYSTPNLRACMKIGKEVLNVWRKQGLRPLIESGHGVRADYWHSDDVIEFLRRLRDGGKR